MTDDPIAPCKLTIAISAAALRANLRTLREVANFGPAEYQVEVSAAAEAQTAMLAVIKADAYGHGATLCAPVLARAGAEWLGVSDAREGAAVRLALDQAGMTPQEQPRILVMCGSLPEDAETIRTSHLTPVVWTPAQLAGLAAVHRAGEPPLPVHVEIDTGMGRQGVAPGRELAKLLHEISAIPELCLDGVLTHFASAEIVGSALTARQQERFAEAVRQVTAAGLRPVWLHAGNSSTLDDAGLLPWLRRQAAGTGAQLLARSGLAVFGYVLPLKGEAAGAADMSPHLQRRLVPAATWLARLLAVRDVQPGDTVGYNATFAAMGLMRVGLLGIGYADGLRRELSSTNETTGGWVLVHGQNAHILGRISMNLTTVDLTGLPNVAAGDAVVVLGEGVSAEVHAALAGTIPYEILCGMRGERVLVS